MSVNWRIHFPFLYLIEIAGICIRVTVLGVVNHMTSPAERDKNFLHLCNFFRGCCTIYHLGDKTQCDIIVLVMSMEDTLGLSTASAFSRS